MNGTRVLFSFKIKIAAIKARMIMIKNLRSFFFIFKNLNIIFF